MRRILALCLITCMMMTMFTACKRGGGENTQAPSDTSAPTTEPTTVPTDDPTTEPTTEPTAEPTVEPTAAPMTEPATVPTMPPETKPTAPLETKPTTPPETQPPAQDARAAAIEKATKASVIFEGGDNNKAAIAAVLQKAENGQPITVVCLGDSQTKGHNAIDTGDKCWVELVGNWLKAKYPNAKVTMVNSGISATESVFGVCRIQRDALDYNPDLVILDLGCNDPWERYYREAYEGMVCKLLCAGVPVINLNVCPNNGQNVQTAKTPINKQYGVPQISFKTAYYDTLKEHRSIRGLRIQDLWAADNTHLTANAHQLTADLITSYLQTYILDAKVSAGKQNTTLPATPITQNRYKDAILLESDDLLPNNVQLNLGGWTGDYNALIANEYSSNGWQARSFGATMTFQVNCGYFEIFYMRDNRMGALEIRVDGQLVGTINEQNPAFVHTYPYHAVHLDTASPHTVELTLVQRGGVANPWFGICGIGIANHG